MLLDFGLHFPDSTTETSNDGMTERAKCRGAVVKCDEPSRYVAMKSPTTAQSPYSGRMTTYESQAISFILLIMSNIPIDMKAWIIILPLSHRILVKIAFGILPVISVL
jgi:hypothetical protein